MSKNTYTPGEILTYTGRGFIGFRRSCREVEFVRYEGMSDAWVKYDGYNVLVSKYDLARAELKRPATP